MNNMLNSKLLELLSGIDRSKLEEVSKMVSNMSKDDLGKIVDTIGQSMNNKEEQK